MTDNLIEYKDWYILLIEECKDIITETEFASRWALVEGYHSLGLRILKDNDNFERAQIYGEKILQRVAESLGKKERTIYYAVQFAREYPDLSMLKEGKNISWHHIINKYLTKGEEKPKPISKDSLLKIIEAIKKLLQDEWNINNQIIQDTSGMLDKGEARIKCDFIRYIQDQIEKIVNDNNNRKS